MVFYGESGTNFPLQKRNNNNNNKSATLMSVRTNNKKLVTLHRLPFLSNSA